MLAKVLAAAGSALVVCGGLVLWRVERPQTVALDQPAPAQPAPAAPQPAPPYVEEGTVVNGLPVQPPPTIDNYVLIDGGWYYWHPELRLWVHAHRPDGWRPGPSAHVYRRWTDDPIYRAAPAPPVVVAPAAPPPVAPPPAYVEEGTVVNGVVVTPPPDIDAYVFYNGGYYYWLPHLNLWVHAHHPPGWRPQPSARVYHTWNEHPMYRGAPPEVHEHGRPGPRR